MLSELQWAAFERDGYVVLDGVASATDLASLNQRLDDLRRNIERFTPARAKALWNEAFQQVSGLP